VTDQPMDYRDYLIRKQQQDRMAQRFDALFTKDEDHAAAAAQGIENLAYHAAQEAAAAYDHIEESLKRRPLIQLSLASLRRTTARYCQRLRHR
jgi:ParB-like chromosome segregation protein Spo0J